MAKVYPRMISLRTSEALLQHAASLDLSLPFEETLLAAPDSPMAQPYMLTGGKKIGNRYCIHPMEGWDGTPDGKPSDLTFRRWRNFGLSGAKLIWGGEATAVRPDGRANPNQLMMLDETMSEMEQLHRTLMDEHRLRFGAVNDLLVGLQLTHSGRFSRPNIKTKLEPKILYHHPLLDELFKIDPNCPVMSDAEIEDLIGYYVRAAKRAQAIGFEFVDIKHCHGYLGHEFLSAYDRPGPYGGSFENRTRFLREITAGIRRECPGLRIGVRVSAFDFPPFRPGEDGVGKALEYRNAQGLYPYAFGGDPRFPGRPELTEVIQFLGLLQSLDIELVNFSAGSPYYNPHCMRPATFPPSDGYQPPEDPLAGVVRHIQVGAELKSYFPKLAMVGSAYTYLQDWLPNVAQAVVGAQKIDFVGLGRMVLSYPDLPADVLEGRALKRGQICRTFSDCTTAPRMGLISGCYPLDHYYKERSESQTLKELKKSN